MMREWAIVVAWQQGIATLRCEQKLGCSGCQANRACGMKALEKLGPGTVHEIKVAYEHPLQPGQKVELGIAETVLLRSALLVYLLPLLTLFLGAGLGQLFAENNLAIMFGGGLGGYLGFILARIRVKKIEQTGVYQPVILHVVLPLHPNTSTKE